MAVHVVATDCITNQILIRENGASPHEGMFSEESCGAFRGFLFGMLINTFLVAGGAALWMLLRR